MISIPSTASNFRPYKKPIVTTASPQKRVSPLYQSTTHLNHFQKKISYPLFVQVAQGTFGLVFRGWDRKRNVEAIIKLDSRATESSCKHYMKEIAILNEVKGCRHVVQLIDSYEYDKGRYALVFQVCQFEVYETFLKPATSEDFFYLSINDIKIIGSAVLETLQDLEKQNIVHGDLKPENLMYDKESRETTVIDFGNAFHPKTVQYPPDRLLQTRYYRAPECACYHTPAYSMPMDIWSLGCILYELYTNTILFSTPELENDPKELQSNVDLVYSMRARLGEDFPPTWKLPPCSAQYRAMRLFPWKGAVQKAATMRKDKNYHDFINLLSSLLVFDYEKRMRPTEALQSRFFSVIIPSSKSNFTPFSRSDLKAAGPNPKQARTNPLLRIVKGEVFFSRVARITLQKCLVSDKDHIIFKASSTTHSKPLSVKINKERPFAYSSSKCEIANFQKAKNVRNIVPLLEWRLYKPFQNALIFPSYKGSTLPSMLTTLSSRDIKIIGKKILEMLQDLEKLKLIHADLKMSNIVYDKENGTVLIPNLENAYEYKERSKLVHFSLQPMENRSPESAFQSIEDYGPPMDMWSVGCILYELYTRHVLFEQLDRDPKETEKDNIHLIHLMHKQLGELPPRKWLLSLSKQMGEELTISEQLSPKKLFDKLIGNSVKGAIQPAFVHWKEDIAAAAKEKQDPEAAKLVDLLSRIFCFNPKKRVSYSEALRHPFFAQSPQEEEKENPNALKIRKQDKKEGDD